MARREDDQLGDLLLQSGAGHFTQHLLIDLAGDLVTGTLLSQIIYWFRPDKDGHTKLRVEREDRLWLAKLRTDWWHETRISPKQFDRSLAILRQQGLIETRLWRFGGFTTLHIWLNLPAVVEGAKALLPKGQYRDSPKVETAIDLRGKPLPTETTDRKLRTEITDIPEDFTPTPLETALFDLPYWKVSAEADREWLGAFSIEWPELSEEHVRACRDYHDGKRVSHKGQWKSRLRNWMRIDSENKGRGATGSARERRTLPTDDELREKAGRMGLSDR